MQEKNNRIGKGIMCEFLKKAGGKDTAGNSLKKTPINCTPCSRTIVKNEYGRLKKLPNNPF
jgi:hypothetical protein